MSFEARWDFTAWLADAGLWLVLLVCGVVLLACRRRLTRAATRAVTVAGAAFLAVPVAHLGERVWDAVEERELSAWMRDDPLAHQVEEEDARTDWLARLEAHSIRRWGRVVWWSARGLDAASVLAVAWAVAAGRRRDTLNRE